jgi:hypothetical protein
MKLLEKAYRVWVHSHIGEYPVFKPNDVSVIYAKNVSEAKGKCDLRDAKNRHGEPARYIDIFCQRVQHMDRVEGNDGYPTLRFQYMEQLQKDKRNEKLQYLDENETYYVQDARSYLGNSVFWWALNSNGYTTYINKAQKYTKDEIIKRFSNGRDTDIIWNSKHVEENVSSHVDIQNLDRKLSV